MSDKPAASGAVEKHGARGLRRFAILALLGAIYFVAARASLLLSFEDTNASPIWPPSGIALAALLLVGARGWPLVLCGALAANLVAFASNQALGTRLCLVSLMIAVGNSAEAVVASALLRRLGSGGAFLGRLREVAYFVPIIALACGVSAGVGTCSLVLGGVADAGASGTILLTWWLGDLTGMLIVTPLIVSLWEARHRAKLALRPKLLALLQLLAAGVLAWAVFGWYAHAPRLLVYLVFPCLAFAAFRYSQVAVTSTATVWAVIAVRFTIVRTGPFAVGPLNDALIMLDSFVALVGLTGLVLSADVRERTERTGSAPKLAEVSQPWAALLGCLALSLGAWHAVSDETERRAEDRFSLGVGEIQRRIEERMLAYAQILRGGAGLFAASEKVSRVEWHNYIGAQWVDGDFGGLLAVGYAARVRDSQRTSLEDELHAQGVSNYAVFPPGERAEYVPVVYLEPMEGRNLLALGYDMLSDATRREALDRARDGGDVAITAKVTLIQDAHAGKQAGFLMYAPRYNSLLPHNSLAERRASLAGYIYAPFRSADLMRAMLGEPEHTQIELFDGDAIDPNALMYESEAHEHGHAAPAHHPYVRTVTLNVGQRHWTLRGTSQASFEQEIDRQKAQIVFIAGTALSLLFFGMVRALALTRMRAVELAEGMTIALREAETRFTSLVAATQEGIVMLDGEGALVSWNNGASEMFGYSASAVRGSSWLTLVAERDRVALSGYWPRLAVSDPLSRRSVEVLGRAANGREFPMEISLSSWLSRDSRVYGLILRDVSDRQRAAEFFRTMFDDAPDAILAVSQKGMIVRANAQAVQMFGFSQQELNGRSIEDLVPENLRMVHGAHRNALGDLRARRRMGGGLDVYARKADGTQFPVDVSLSNLRLSAGDLVVASVTDVSERKRTAERLHATLALQTAILDGSALSIIATDQTGAIVCFNRAARELLGYQEREVIGQRTPIIFHLPSELRERAEALTRETGRQFEPGFEVMVSAARAGGIDEREWTFVRKDGGTIPVLLVVSALHDLNGKVSGFLGIAADISERKQREAALQAALREKETLLKEVYHRVKNNMQVVSSLFNMQLRRLPEGPARQALQDGVERVRAMALVHEKLYQSADLSSIKLDDYVSELCSQLGVAAGVEERRIVFRKALEPIGIGLDAAVPLGLLINELVSNSLKHGFPDGRAGEIGISLRREADFVQLEVWDNGVGFAHEPGAERAGSLGLRLVKTLSSQLDGELSIQDRAGAHTSLRFRLEEPKSTVLQA